MKVYESSKLESEVIPLNSYKTINEKDLNEDEKLILLELNEIMKKMGLDNYYHLGNYREESICLFKNNDLWEVYITERGNCYNKVVYDNCLEACFEVILQACDNKKDAMMVMDIMKEMFVKKEKIELDHVDIVTSHLCNNNCLFCIDKFLRTSNEIISLENIEKFLDLIREYTDKRLTVLLLGGEPTVLPKDKLIDIANLVHQKGFRVTMSTNGKLRNKIVELISYFDSIQITVDSNEEIDFYRRWSDKINIKLAGDSSLTIEKLNHFISYTEGFSRRSISMYFTPDFSELCSSREVWELLDTLDWRRNGSYMYAFYKGVRIKKCIPGETNIIDEPTIPKLYPNGNYNKTWNNEELDDYLSLDGKRWDKNHLIKKRTLN